MILDLTLSYFQEWTIWLNPIEETFKWIELKGILHWTDGDAPIKATVDMLIEKKILKQNEYDGIFNQFCYVKSYLSSQPNIFESWNLSNCSIENRWVHIFSHLKEKSLSFDKISKLVEYCLMIPGD